MNNDHLPIYKSSKWLIWNNNFTLISYLFTSHPCTHYNWPSWYFTSFFGGRGFGNDQLTPILTVKLPHVHQQKGITDWGLFAIAFAVHLAFGDDVSKLTCDQSQMSLLLLPEERNAAIPTTLHRQSYGFLSGRLNFSAVVRCLKLAVTWLHATNVVTGTTWSGPVFKHPKD